MLLADSLSRNALRFAGLELASIGWQFSPLAPVCAIKPPLHCLSMHPLLACWRDLLTVLSDALAFRVEKDVRPGEHPHAGLYFVADCAVEGPRFFILNLRLHVGDAARSAALSHRL